PSHGTGGPRPDRLRPRCADVDLRDRRAGEARRAGSLPARPGRVAHRRRVAGVPGRDRRDGRVHPRRGACAERRRLSAGRAARTVGHPRACGRRPALDHAPPMLTLAYPWLLAVLPLPLAVWWLVPPYRERREGLRVPFLPRLARLTGQRPTAGAVVLRSGWLRSA